jgi:hypothetical protein
MAKGVAASSHTDWMLQVDSSSSSPVPDRSLVRQSGMCFPDEAPRRQDGHVLELEHSFPHWIGVVVMLVDSLIASA